MLFRDESGPFGLKLDQNCVKIDQNAARKLATLEFGLFNKVSGPLFAPFLDIICITEVWDVHVEQNIPTCQKSAF